MNELNDLTLHHAACYAAHHAACYAAPRATTPRMADAGETLRERKLRLQREYYALLNGVSNSPKQTIPQIKAALAARGLSREGNKAQLKRRLKDAFAEPIEDLPSSLQSSTPRAARRGSFPVTPVDYRAAVDSGEAYAPRVAAQNAAEVLSVEAVPVEAAPVPVSPPPSPEEPNWEDPSPEEPNWEDPHWAPPPSPPPPPPPPPPTHPSSVALSPATVEVAPRRIAERITGKLVICLMKGYL